MLRSYPTSYTDSSRSTSLAHREALSIFLARGKVSADVIVHFRFVCIPAPGTVFLDRNVLERIKTKPLKTFVPGTRCSIADISVPEVKDISIDECKLGFNRIVERFSPH